MPTSMTTAPGFTMSAVIICGRPAATIRMSARRVCDARSRVRLWQTVTVASTPGCTISDAIGLPTMLLRPTITQSAPAVVTPLACSMYSTPAGVHGAKPSFSPIEQLADVHRMEAVDVLVGTNAANDRVRIDLLRQRHLHEDSVNRRIVVQLVDDREQLVLRDRRRPTNRLAVHAELDARALLGADVDRARRIVADEHDRQARA